MFNKFNLLTGILALLLFTYAQSQSWSLFDNVANAGGGSGGGSSGSGRIYHK